MLAEGGLQIVQAHDDVVQICMMGLNKMLTRSTVSETLTHCICAWSGYIPLLKCRIDYPTGLND